MRVTDKAIVLQTVRYGDKKNILRLFTRDHGLVSVTCILGNSPNAKIKSSAVLPLSLLDVELITKQNKDVQQLTEASCYYVTTNISSSISKLSIAQFLNEILLKLLKEQAANASLYDFIENCFKFLNESEDDHMNLHVYFLMELTKYLGIEPSNNYSSSYNAYFDCRDGQFTSTSLAFPLGLDKDDSILFSEFLKINCLNEKLSNYQRQKLVSILIAYYQMHMPGFNEVKSLEVLREVVTA
ncbi:MAG: repair protein RecO [Bacteroidetes bacterium]|jgi:DNA repair protein RecO (recombination protein O)|nr:repair protein RecO [Bacteroidota bacterium]